MNSSQVQERGNRMVTIRNRYIEATISNMGAELVSLKNLKTSRELIWEGNPVFWKYHAPVLFPIVGSLNMNEYRYNGKTYKMRQHGFAREKEFRLIRQTDTSVVHVLESDEKLKEIYPFDFRLEISQTLEQNRLVVRWSVKNLDPENRMYFSIGAQPAFRLPERKNGFYIYFPGERTLSYILKDLKADAADPGQIYLMMLEDGYLQLEDHLFDIDTYIFEGNQIQEVSLCGPDKKPFVTVHCTGSPYFALWSRSDFAPFVCLIPWYGRLDNRGFKGELPEKEGIIRLEGGGTFNWWYEIEVI